MIFKKHIMVVPYPESEIALLGQVAVITDKILPGLQGQLVPRKYTEVPAYKEQEWRT